VDNLPIEFFKCVNEEGLNEITDLCNKIYETGIWPEDFVKTIIIPIPKKIGTIKCSEFRTISLLSHASKILLRILNRRLKRIMEEDSGDEQFGFRSGRGTRDAIGLLRIVGERYIERGKGMYLCFVDLEKAFDRVIWVKIMKILKERNVDWRDRRLIKELYMRQRASVKVNEGRTEWVELGRGVRQGCCLSPTLFNLYIEEMMRNVMQEEDGISVGGRRINCIRFADDMVLMADNMQALQRLITILEKGMEPYGMRINARKTKVMGVNVEEVGEIRAGAGVLERVDSYQYLGTSVTKDWRSTTEIKRRIAMAKEAFGKGRNLFCSPVLKLDLRKRLAKCYVWSTLLYGSEAWTMGKREMSRIEAFEMWVWRRMERISWKDKVRNEEVLARVNEERRIMREIKKRKSTWLGHIMRGGGILAVAVEGSIGGRVTRGRRRIKLTDGVKLRTYRETKEMARDRSGWRRRWRIGPANWQNTT